MSNLVCVWCFPDLKDSSKTEGLCSMHFKDLKEDLISSGYELVEPKKMKSKTGKCFICTIDCTQKSFCYGCGEFVCNVCVNTEDLVAGNHTNLAHVKALLKSGTN